ncbi:MAG: Rpb4 family DNA-directed RNA polymerase subunit [archaeon]|nr:Rpb4 family DNA-directed RNA polymerase subunit [archaeon]
MTCSYFEFYAILKDRSSQLTAIDYEKNPILYKTKEYIERFNKYGFQETSEKSSSKAVELRKILEADDKFERVEIAQIIDLLPQSADEAFSLIPSLKLK